MPLLATERCSRWSVDFRLLTLSRLSLDLLLLTRVELTLWISLHCPQLLCAAQADILYLSVTYANATLAACAARLAHGMPEYISRRVRCGVGEGGQGTVGRGMKDSRMKGGVNSARRNGALVLTHRVSAHLSGARAL